VSALSLIRHEGVVTILLESPILERKILSELSEILDAFDGESPPPPLVLASNHQTIFLAGAHLGEIAELDPQSCVDYARCGRGVANRLSSHPAPVVAAVHGSCSGGGFDLAIACDAVVASAGATFSHPGAFRGLVTGWGGTSRLPAAMGESMTRRALLEGTELDAADLKEMGVVHAIVDNPQVEAHSIALGLCRLHPSRLPLWRHFRGPSFVDRFRAFVVEKS